MEWDLLVQSEGITAGTMIRVDEEDGSTTMLKFRKKAKDIVHLSDSEGNIRKFDADSLEEVGGSAMIAGSDD